MRPISAIPAETFSREKSPDRLSELFFESSLSINTSVCISLLKLKRRS